LLRRNSDTFFRPREGDSGLRCWWKRIRLALQRYRLQATGCSVQVHGWLLAINGGARKPQKPHPSTTDPHLTTVSVAKGVSAMPILPKLQEYLDQHHVKGESPRPMRRG
jgi:hypothetical protein